MRQSASSNNKSIVNSTDREAIRQALAILEKEGVHTTIEDNTIEIPVPASTINNNTIGERLKKKIHQYHHKHSQQYQQNQQHALLSPSRSTATRRASVKNLNSKSKQVQESCSSSNITASTADLDSCASTTSYEDSYSYSCTTTSSSLNKLDKNKEVDDKAKRKSRTKRSSSNNRQQRHSHVHKSKKGEDKSSSSSSSSSSGVRFAKYDQLEYIPHINDMSHEEINARWMNEEDYNSIRLRSLRLVEMIEDPKRYPISADTMIVNKHLVCVRGLGDMTSHCVYARDLMQRRLQTAVFQLQSQQQEDGVRDPQALRQMSRKYSKPSTKSARFVGISDGVTISNRHGLRNHLLNTI